MKREIVKVALAAALGAWIGDEALGVTREIAAFSPARLTFGQSVLNQLSYETYRDPFDELQSRPYNLLFNNIGRHANLSPWPGQEGAHARYVNALIGNNGTANVDNDADAIQGSMIRRETGAVAWGLSAAVLAGNNGSDDANGTAVFSNDDDLLGLDLRGGVAWRMNDRRVLGGGIRLVQLSRERIERSFEPGTGGFNGFEKFDQLGVSIDAGLRQFVSERSSWETQVVLGFGNATQEVYSETRDDLGVVTDRFVTQNYELGDLGVGAYGGYSRLHADRVGEVEFRGGLEWSQRDLGNDDLSYADAGGVITPSLTLTAQDAVVTTRAFGSARTVFQAGETEIFAAARLSWQSVGGATAVDAAGTPVREEVDDARLELGVTLGVRQPLLRDKLRVVVSGRGDLARDERRTLFDAGSERDTATSSSAQYAVGLEGVLANVTFDLAWVFGEEVAVAQPVLGIPAGSRRSVQLDRLVFSAAVAW
jgi:hypothetical protein